MRALPVLILLSAILASVPVLAQQPVAASPDYRVLIGEPNRAPISGDALAAETERVSGLLRCPVCQGLSVADSPVSMATNMRREVEELLSRGYDQQQVLAYFEKSYGEFVLLEPPRRGINWLVWLAPVALLLGGAFVVFRATRRLRSAGRPVPEQSVDPELEPYIRRVREIAYGKSPEETV